jgi:hypothetical protein
MKLEKLFEMYTAYVLDDKSRRSLAKVFPPKYPEFVGHHITLKFGVPKDTKKPRPADISIVGYADDGEGLEALVVSVNGKTIRPDGKTYHITWSLDRSKGRKPVQSNALVQQGYQSTGEHPVNTTSEVLR